MDTNPGTKAKCNTPSYDYMSMFVTVFVHLILLYIWKQITFQKYEQVFPNTN